MDNVVRHGPKSKDRQISNQPVSPMSFKGIPTRRLSDFPSLHGLKPSLTWLKIHHPNKGYKLVWEFMNKVVWCGENQIVYKNRGRVIEAGEQLGSLLGVNFKK